MAIFLELVLSMKGERGLFLDCVSKMNYCIVIHTYQGSLLLEDGDHVFHS